MSEAVQDLRPPAARTDVISFHGVGKSFRAEDGGGYTAVRDVDLCARHGRFVSIVGPSGCGKSTVLNMAAGLLAPTVGRIHSFGATLEGRNSHASYMFQQDALLPWKNIIDNVALGLRFRHVHRDEARARASDWLARVGLSRVERSYPHQLSGGMRKRAAIAQSWIVDPDLLLMDEPFSALDVQTRKMMEDELLQLWGESTKTVLFITHDLDEAISLSDEVLLMSAGPGSTVVARYEIDLPRPRNLLDIRTTDAFQEIYLRIWSRLKEEVATSYARSQEPTRNG